MKKEFRSSMTRTMSAEVEASKKGSESIHSGQFMVSHFEAEETQGIPFDTFDISFCIIRSYRFL